MLAVYVTVLAVTVVFAGNAGQLAMLAVGSAAFAGAVLRKAGPRGSARRLMPPPLIRLVAGAILCFFFPVFFTEISLTEVTSRPELLLVLFVTVYAGGRLAGHIARGRPLLLDLTFWVFTYTFLGMAPLAQMAARQFPQGGFYGSDDLFRTATIIAVWVGAYEVGRLYSTRLPLNLQPSRRGLSLKFILATAAFAIVGTLVAVQAFGLDPFFNSRSALTNASLGVPVRAYLIEDKAVSSIQRLVAQVPSLLAMIALFTMYKGQRKPRWFYPLIGALAVTNVIVNNFISTPRHWFGTVVFGIVAIWIAWDRKTIVRLVIVGLIASSLFLMDYLDAFRRADQVNFGTSPIAERLVSHPDYGPVQQMYDLARYVEDWGTTGGRQILGAVLVFYPRSMWPTKPQGSWFVVTPTLQYNGALPLPGEFYLDFAWFGLLVGGLLWGWMTASVDRFAYAGLLGRKTWVATWVPVLAAFQLFFLRGSLQPAMGLLIPLVAVMWFITRPSIGSRRGVRARRPAEYSLIDYQGP